MKISHFLLPLVVVSAVGSPLLAEQITITDCNGFPRVVKELEPNSTKSSQLKLTLSEIAAGDIEVKLTNSKISAEKIFVAKNGVAIVSGLEPGLWIACPTTAGVSVQDVAFISETRGSSLAPVALAGLGLVGGGIALGSNGSGGGNDSDAGPEVASSIPAAPEAPASKPAAGSAERPAISKPPDQHVLDQVVDCGTSDRPTPLSPIS